MEKSINPVCTLITGASSGIGYACARWLVEHDCLQIVITGRTELALEEARASLEQLKGDVSVIPIRCDHSRGDDVEQLIATMESRNLVPDAVIANVGDNPVHRLGPRRSAAIGVELLQQTFETNLVNAHRLLAPLLDGQLGRGGRIVLVGSQAYQLGVKGQLPYNVSKAALVGYKNTIVSEYAHKGVFCHLVNPGLVLNQRTANLRRRLAPQGGVTEEYVAEAIGCTLFQTTKNGLERDI